MIHINDPRRINIPRDDLYEKYIVENLTLEETANFFGVTVRTLKRRLQEHGIKRDTKMTYQNRQKGMLKKYGVDHPNKSPEFKEKRKNTMLARYGVEYTAQSPELQQKMQQTMRERYGKSNYVETTSFQEKSQETCMAKYGVKTPCQYPQCIKALEEAAGHSKPETAFASLLDKYHIPYEQEYPLRGFKYDFKVGNYLIEIDPSGTHNINFGLFGHDPKPVSYHYTKSSVAKEFGFHCIHVFDWDDYDKIIHTFLLDKERVYARGCDVRPVSSKEAAKFLDKHHLQGYARDEIRLGLYDHDALVEIMTFAKPRYNQKYDYELVRLCSCKNVVGGAEKLLHHFQKEHPNAVIISYCDLSKFDGKIYKKLGFKCINKPRPSRHWVNLNTKQHITDNLLRQKGFDQLFKTKYGKGAANDYLMRNHNFVEVYDCGQLTLVRKDNL